MTFDESVYRTFMHRPFENNEVIVVPTPEFIIVACSWDDGSHWQDTSCWREQCPTLNAAYPPKVLTVLKREFGVSVSLICMTLSDPRQIKGFPPEPEVRSI